MHLLVASPARRFAGLAFVLWALLTAADPAATAQTAATADDAAAARTLVAELEQSKPPPATVSDAVERAKEALERGIRLRRTGDEAHARMADGLAREWAETARDLARAAQAEAAVADLRRKAMTEQEQAERTRALVEEGVARVGRLRAQVDAIRGPDAAGRRAVEVHDGGADRGKDATARDAPAKNGRTKDAPAADATKKNPRDKEPKTAPRSPTASDGRP
jgi:hypothetical protein